MSAITRAGKRVVGRGGGQRWGGEGRQGDEHEHQVGEQLGDGMHWLSPLMSFFDYTSMLYTDRFDQVENMRKGHNPFEAIASAEKQCLEFLLSPLAPPRQDKHVQIHQVDR